MADEISTKKADADVKVDKVWSSSVKIDTALIPKLINESNF